MMQVIDLEQLSENSAFAISDLLSDDEFDFFDGLTLIERVTYRYNHADCDDLAYLVHLATGWDVIAVHSELGPIHRLNCDPSGRLLDASGWVTLKQLEDRYRSVQLTLSERGQGASACQSILEEPEDFVDVISAALLFETAPFTKEIRSSIEAHALSIGINVSRENTIIPHSELL